MTSSISKEKLKNHTKSLLDKHPMNVIQPMDLAFNIGVNMALADVLIAMAKGDFDETPP